MAEGLPELIEKGDIGPKDDPKERNKKLREDFNWDKAECEKIWAFGPDTTGPNLLVDMTRGV